jgi:predicted DsbA family dithiol-disulfide isomerase
MQQASAPELWVWAEYYCPWSYIAVVRLEKVAREYQGRVSLVNRPFPLEVYGGGPPKKQELDQEWWLAALQEPAAAFRLYQYTDWPTTTLPAFEAVWCASQQDDTAARNLDLRIRKAFFAESVNIGRREIYSDLAREVGLEMPAFHRLFESSQPQEAVLEEGRLGKEQFGVRSTPTLMLRDGKRLHQPIAYPQSENDQIVSVEPLPCCGEGCYEATRALFDQALADQLVDNV